MSKKLMLISLACIAGITFFSCVPAKEFQTLQDKNQKCEEERERFLTENESLTVKVTELEARIKVLTSQVDVLMRDSVNRSLELKRLTEDNETLTTRYAELQRVQESLVQGNVQETRKVLVQLQKTQEELQEKEDALKELERRLNQRRLSLEQLQADLERNKAEIEKMRLELEERNARLVELEKILARKDSAVLALRRKVSDALFGFEGKGLSVKMQNGKVYVSLEEKLMFKSGSYVVDPKGASAIKQLIPVLEQNTDINIMVEGHTDDVPLVGKGDIKDNWDLSAKRATSIVRILLESSKINPKRITAAGRGEFYPIDPAKTPEARQKNRRTEIILTPKLDELFEILEVQ